MKSKIVFILILVPLFFFGCGGGGAKKIDESQNDGETSGFDEGDFGDSGGDVDFGDSGGGADFGDSGEGADFGDSGGDVDFGDSGEGADFGDSGEDVDFGDSGGDFDGDEGDSGEDDNLGFCGDGIKNGDEFCDDGDKNGKYGYCKPDCSGLGERCGDGIKNGDEVCDDGDKNGEYDYCNSDCSGPGKRCGDGQKNGDEECDNGAVKNGKSDCEYGLHSCIVCDSSCKKQMGETSYCGDGKIDETNGEVCDDGDKNGKYGYCKPDCSGLGKHCGDGIVNGDEICDNGENNGEYGYCDSDCSGPGKRCGDGIKNGPEFCDDGELNGTYNRCKSDCSGLDERCGNGIIQRENCAGFTPCDEATTTNCCAETPGLFEVCDKSADNEGNFCTEECEFVKCEKESATPCRNEILVWSQKPAEAKTWSEAKKYCEDLKEGGYADWRLPTISELRTLIRECGKTLTNGQCKLIDACLSFSTCWTQDECVCEQNESGKYSLFGDKEGLWSKSKDSAYPNRHWGVNFSMAGIALAPDSSTFYVRCVNDLANDL